MRGFSLAADKNARTLSREGANMLNVKYRTNTQKTVEVFSDDIIENFADFGELVNRLAETFGEVNLSIHFDAVERKAYIQLKFNHTDFAKVNSNYDGIFE